MILPAVFHARAGSRGRAGRRHGGDSHNSAGRVVGKRGVSKRVVPPCTAANARVYVASPRSYSHPDPAWHDL
eukprot:6369963-Lingulodinium_polyedra.AAC.1